MSIRFQSVTPQFTVPDVVQTAEYYRDVLGFTIEGYWMDPPVFAIVSRDKTEVFFSRAEKEEYRSGRAPGAYDAYFRVSAVDALAEQFRASGAEIVDGPDTRVYGQRELIVVDCNGLILAFGEPVM